jgi:hypoxanthine phosphoribosyltransferase
MERRVDDVQRLYLTWNDVAKLVSKMMSGLQTRDYDVVLAITRGGIVPSAIISERLAVPQVLVASVDFYEDPKHDLDWPVFMQFPADSFLRGKYVLIVDDVWNRGKEMVSVSERVDQAGGSPSSAVLHYKPHRSQFPDKSPDFYAEETKDWIIYPWELDRSALGT